MTKTAAATAANAAASSGTKRKCGYISPSCDPLTDLALQFSELAINLVVNHLPVRDTLALQTANRPWRGLVSEHEDELFKKYLKRDFKEGNMLVDVVEGRYGANRNNDGATSSRLTYKRLYLAFERRSELHKTAENNVCIHWRKPSHHSNEDVQRLGPIETPNGHLGRHCLDPLLNN